MGRRRTRLTQALGGSAAALLVVALTSCTGGSTPGHGHTIRAGCPTQYAAPDPNRPRMTLDFTVAADHRTVEGTETVVFRPDLPISELVFRLTANTASSVAEGNSIVVLSATADHGGGPSAFTTSNAAASTQGGLLHIPFASTLPAGTVVTAHLAFRLTLGGESFDRFGRAGPYAYFGSGEPLLAWQRGFGWHTEDMTDIPGESATSEAMDVRLAVHAPARDVVIMSGDPADPPPATSGERTWRSHVPTARDVSVAVGPFVVADSVVDGVRLRLGAPSLAIRDELVLEFRRAITALVARFGPYPFGSLSVARVPARGGGIEYPSSILMLDGSRLVAVHETAHQWFYGMVGDSQALHPWLDEAFATYAEQLVNRDAPPPQRVLSFAGAVDRSVESYGTNSQQYYFFTYAKGAAALMAARAASGPQAWDAAMRCYIAANAWRIATPGDFAHAIANLPAGVAVMRRAGAIR